MKHLNLNVRRLRKLLPPFMIASSIANTANFVIHLNLYVNLPQQQPVPTVVCPVNAKPK